MRTPVVFARAGGAILLVVSAAGNLMSETVTLATTYPSPAGIYNYLVTTGNSAATAADTTLNRNAGNTILAPQTNADGVVLIGTTATPIPGAKLNIRVPSGRDILFGSVPDSGGTSTGLGVVSGTTKRSMFYSWEGSGANPMVTAVKSYSGAPLALVVDNGQGTSSGSSLWLYGNGDVTFSPLSPASSFRVNNNLFASQNATVTRDLTVGGAITAAGVITSNFSDARLKTDIHEVTGALELLDGLPPVRYSWRPEFAAENDLAADRQWGLLAQDVEKVLPELVSEDEKGRKRLTYGQELNMLALAAIRELKAKSDGQQAELDRLRAELKALKERK